MEDQRNSSDKSYVDSSQNEIGQHSFQGTIDKNSNITYQEKQSTSCRITDQENVKKKKWINGDVENSKDCCDSETTIMNKDNEETIRKEKVKKNNLSPLSYRNLEAKSPQTNTIPKWLNKYNCKSASSSSSTAEVYKECKENVGDYKTSKKKREFIEKKSNYCKSSGKERKHKRPRKRNKISSNLPECDSSSPKSAKKLCATTSPVARKLFVMDSSFVNTERESLERIGSSLPDKNSAVRSDGETTKLSVKRKSSKDKHGSKKCSGASKLVLYDFLGVSPKESVPKSRVELKSSALQGKSDKGNTGQDRCVTPIKQRRIQRITEIRKSPRTKKKSESVSSKECKELMRKYLSKRKRNEADSEVQCKLPSSSSSVAKTTWLSKYSPRNKSDNAQGTSRRSPNSSKTLGKKRKSDNYAKKFKASKEKVSLDDTLDKYMKNGTKSPKQPKFTRSESNESCELPSFIKIKKKDKSRSSESFKKYGVVLPSVEEILKEQKDLEQYRKQIESFKDVDDKFFDLPFSVKDFGNSAVVRSRENVLGCKHLTTDEIDKAFADNLAYISDIFHGRVFNERHDRFFNSAGKNYTFTLKDLCYNTSTIVFTFDQLERLMRMMQKEFDPEDKWTSYFFKVLLPELCLKIFGDAHNMTHEEAVKYLDTRPVIDD